MKEFDVIDWFWTWWICVIRCAQLGMNVAIIEKYNNWEELVLMLDVYRLKLYLNLLSYFIKQIMILKNMV